MACYNNAPNRLGQRELTASGFGGFFYRHGIRLSPTRQAAHPRSPPAPFHEHFAFGIARAFAAERPIQMRHDHCGNSLLLYDGGGQQDDDEFLVLTAHLDHPGLVWKTSQGPGRALFEILGGVELEQAPSDGRAPIRPESPSYSARHPRDHCPNGGSRRNALSPSRSGRSTRQPPRAGDFCDVGFAGLSGAGSALERAGTRRFGRRSRGVVRLGFLGAPASRGSASASCSRGRKRWGSSVCSPR